MRTYVYVGLFLLLTCPVVAQEVSNVVGRIASRANCINNESITWNWETPDDLLPPLRQTVSKHIDNLYDDTHIVSTPWERDWHSFAGHAGEGLPTTILVPYQMPYPCYGGEYTWPPSTCYFTLYFPYEVWDRWEVEGTHTEEINEMVTTRNTSATSCNF